MWEAALPGHRLWQITGEYELVKSIPTCCQTQYATNLALYLSIQLSSPTFSYNTLWELISHASISKVLGWITPQVSLFSTASSQLLIASIHLCLSVLLNSSSMLLELLLTMNARSGSKRKCASSFSTSLLSVLLSTFAVVSLGWFWGSVLSCLSLKPSPLLWLRQNSAILDSSTLTFCLLWSSSVSVSLEYR